MENIISRLFGEFKKQPVSAIASAIAIFLAIGNAFVALSSTIGTLDLPVVPGISFFFFIVGLVVVQGVIFSILSRVSLFVATFGHGLPVVILISISLFGSWITAFNSSYVAASVSSGLGTFITFLVLACICMFVLNSYFSDLSFTTFIKRVEDEKSQSPASDFMSRYKFYDVKAFYWLSDITFLIGVIIFAAYMGNQLAPK